MVSPVFKIVGENGEAGAEFPVGVRNQSDIDVDGEALRIEIRPPIPESQWLLVPDAHDQVIVYSSPSGGNQAQVDVRISDWEQTQLASIQTVRLGTIGPAKTIGFTAKVKTRPGVLLQIRSSTVPLSEAPGVANLPIFLESKKSARKKGQADQLYIVLDEPDGG